MKAKGLGGTVLLGLVCLMFVPGVVSAQSAEPEYEWPYGFSWYGESGAQRAPTFDEMMPGRWWMPDNAPAGQENEPWGNRGYIFVGQPAPKPIIVKEPATPSVPVIYTPAPQAPAPVVVAPEPAERIVYRDRIVEKPVEKIVYVDREKIVEKPVEKIVERIVYRDRIVEVEKPQTVKLTDVYFNFDSSALTPLAETTLSDNLATLKANPGVKVLLIGSASPEGTSAYNQALSQRRVNAVSAWLLKNGLTQERFLTDAIGEIEAVKAEYPSARKVQVNITTK